ncbi:hypothetical protein PR048_006465 [Dryococelus australis]|uniref:Uncharacterized protein n=1 Tax=Dryococelus australis TaxID=614101 RepID=A0ABQ9IB18_9NEOP|nr:hypothetical protein PR048_006465 [Dryococelus australis]
MEEAAGEEAKLAIEAGEVDKDGSPLITAVYFRQQVNLCYAIWAGNKVRYICGNCKVGNLPLQTAVQANAQCLRTAAVSAIKHRKEQSSNYSNYNRIDELKKDILNSPHNIFGNHENCRERDNFCDGSSKPGESDLVPQLKQARIWQELLTAVHHAANNASSLISDVDNNISENFNSIVGKTVGGKRVNFALRNSYETQCEAAFVSANSKGELHRMINKSALKRSPGFHTKKSVSHITKNHRKKHATQSCISNANYGPDENIIVEDISEKESEERKEIFLTQLMNENRKVIEENTRGQSSCHEWKEQRCKRITESFFGKICKMKPTTSCASTFAEENNISVQACDLLVDEEFHYLEASPDGLIGDNAVLEVSHKKKSSLWKLKTASQNLKLKIHICTKYKAFYTFPKGSNATLFVWPPKSMIHEVIRKNYNYWKNKILPNVQNFNFNCLLP